MKLKANQDDFESGEDHFAAPSKHFDIASSSRLVARFQDRDFKKPGKLLKCSKNKWSILFQTQFTGKRLAVYCTVSVADCKYYGLKKQKIDM